MKQYNGNYTDENGRPVKGAAVFVYTSEGVTADIADVNGNPIAQPLLTDEDGNFSYRAPDGYYQHMTWVGKRRVLIENGVLIGPSYLDAAAASAAAAESVSGPTYPDTASGLAATPDGKTFAVDNGDGTVTIYLNDGGVAVAQRTLATTAALAAATGGTLVGTQQIGANTRLRDTRDKANDVVSLYDFADMYPGVATDSSAGMAKAIADGRALTFPNGTVKIDSEMVISAAQFEMFGAGGNSVLDFSGGGSLLIKADPVKLPNLAGEVVGGSHIVEFASAHSLVEGDVFALWNPNDHSWGSSAWTTRPYYRDGRMFRVAKVVDTVKVIIYGVAPRAFAANFECWKLTGGKICLRDFRIIPSAAVAMPIRIDGFQRVDLADVTADKGASSTAIELTRCYDFRVAGTKATALTNDAYPVVISNCQLGTVFNCTLYSIRHAVALGGRDGVMNVPTADVLVSHCRLLNDATEGVGAADVHGCCENITYSHCIMNSGAVVGGRNISLLYNTIYGRPPSLFADGLCISGSEIVGGTYRFIGNRLITSGNAASFGVINLTIKDRTEDFLLVEENNIIESQSASAALRMNQLILGAVAGAHRVDVRIKGMTFLGAGAHSALMLADTADISAIASVAIEGLDAPAGTLFIGATNAANYNIPLRLQSQNGTVTLTCASGTAQIVSGFINFRYRYPRVPSAFCTAAGARVGNRYPTGHVFLIENTRLRAMIHSGDETNWTETADRTASWSVGIEDF